MVAYFSPYQFPNVMVVIYECGYTRIDGFHWYQYLQGYPLILVFMNIIYDCVSQSCAIVLIEKMMSYIFILFILLFAAQWLIFFKHKIPWFCFAEASSPSGKWTEDVKCNEMKATDSDKDLSTIRTNYEKLVKESVILFEGITWAWQN